MSDDKLEKRQSRKTIALLAVTCLLFVVAVIQAYLAGVHISWTISTDQLIRDVTNRIAVATADLPKITEALQSIEGHTADTASSSGAISASVKTATDAIDDIRGDVDEIQLAIDDIKVAVDDIEQDVADIKETVDDILNQLR